MEKRKEAKMSKLGLIINREYSSRVKKKSFLVLTILVPILIVGFLFGVMWLTLENDKQYKVLVADPAGWCDGVIYQDTTKQNPAEFFFYENYLDSVEQFMHEDKFQDYDILVWVTEEAPTSRKVPVFYRENPSLRVRTYVQNRVESRLMEYFALKKTNLTAKEYEAIKQPFAFEFFDGDDPKGEDYSSEQAGVGFAFAILTYMFIFIYSMQVMRGVIEEKTNRVVEVLISSVKPFQLMMGKIIGIGLVGFTQFVVWLILSGIGLSIIRAFVFTDIVDPGNWDSSAMADGMVQTNFESTSQSSDFVFLIFEAINWPLMITSFIIYFIGGFLLYSAIFAAIGAMVDSETDTQQLILPVTMPLVLSYIVASMLITNPTSAVGSWFAVIPFTSPVVMMVKVAMGTVEVWQYITSIVLLFGTFIGTTWLAAKIYRIGILMYGKKASWKEVIKWIKYR
jgi:ABC-2 type transport system permease protein